MDADDQRDRPSRRTEIQDAVVLYAILSRADRAVVTATRPQELFEDICAACVGQGFLMAWVGTADIEGRIRPVAWAGHGTEYLSGIVITTGPDDATAKGPTGQAFLSRRPVLCDDFQADPRTAPWRDRGKAYGWRASAAVPFFEQGRAVGVLTIYSDRPAFFDASRAVLLEDLSNAMTRGLDRFFLEHRQQVLQTALKQSEARFSAVFQASPVAILLGTLAEGRIVDANPAFLRTFEHQHGAVVGRSHAEIGLWADDGDGERLAALLGQGQRVDNMALDVRTASGDLREVLLATQTIALEGVGYWLAMLADVTRVKQAERALVQAEMEKIHAMRLSILGEVASTIAHEVNQPIGAAANFIQAAKAMADNPAQAALLEKAAQQVMRAGATVKRVREFAANRSVDRVQPVDLHAAIDDGCALALLGEGGHGVDLSVSVDHDVGLVMGDPIQLRQVVTNLVRNAVEAVRDTRRRWVAIAARRDGGQVEIAVADGGPGVAEALRPRLFTPFATSKPDGTGLGLSTSRSIIRAHGGDLWYEQHGEGASFKFTLPLGEDNE